MRQHLLYILLLLAPLLDTSPAAAVVIPLPTLPIGLRALLLNRARMNDGPFTFDMFSLRVEKGDGSWENAPASVVTALTVRALTQPAPGLKIMGSTNASSLLVRAKAIELDYRITSHGPAITEAAVSALASTVGGIAGFSDQLTLNPLRSSNTVPVADTQGWSASAAASSGLSASIDFEPAMILSVSNVATIEPGTASSVAFAVDNTFVPEPLSLLLPVLGVSLVGRKRLLDRCRGIL